MLKQESKVLRRPNIIILLIFFRPLYLFTRSFFLLLRYFYQDKGCQQWHLRPTSLRACGQGPKPEWESDYVARVAPRRPALEERPHGRRSTNDVQLGLRPPGRQTFYDKVPPGEHTAGSLPLSSETKPVQTSWIANKTDVSSFQCYSTTVTLPVTRQGQAFLSKSRHPPQTIKKQIERRLKSRSRYLKTQWLNTRYQVS